MKRKLSNLLFAVLAFSLVLGLNIQSAYASENTPGTTESTESTEAPGTTESTEAPAPVPTPTPEPVKPKVYSVTIKFNANGGKGSMSKLKVKSDKKTKLTANKFKRDGYQFTGWSTSKTGKVKYKNKADITKLAKKSNDKKTITLYAQWKLKTPSIKKAMASSPSEIRVTFAKSKNVSGYEIQYSTSSKFKGASTKTIKASKNATYATIKGLSPNKKYYVRMRTYRKVKNKTERSDWSKSTTVKTKKGKTIENTKSVQAIEADVKLSGSGTGYHAKLVMCDGNGGSAVSFGMQYDEGAQAPYGHRNMVLIENISSNNAGGQNYDRPKNMDLSLDEWHHLMMTHDGKGHVDVYVDYEKVGSCYQPGLSTMNNIRIEACARLNGDGVDAEFANIKKKWGTNIQTLGDNLPLMKIKHNSGLNYKYDKKKGIIRLYGKVENVNGDWDSDYDGVSYIVQFD